MKFYNKALTLKKLKCNNAIIPELLIINAKDFLKNKEVIIKNFNRNDYLIVRSSSDDEDTSKKSNAGLFESVPKDAKW